MAFTPVFWAAQEEALIENMLAIVERDFKAAVDAFNPIEAALNPDDPGYFPDFRERALGQILGNEYPCLSIGPLRNQSSYSDGGDRLIERIELEAYIGVTDDSANSVTRRITRYVGAFNSVLYTAALRTRRDFFRNMSTQVFGLTVDLEHVYESVRTNQGRSMYFRSAGIAISITVNER